MNEELIEYLKSFINRKRYDRMIEVLQRRTEYLTVVLEDLHYSQNASSIIRHCDAFGIQNLHVIENKNKFKVKNHAVRGTLKWITLNHFNDKKENSLKAIASLKEEGYRIIATSPEKGGSTPSTFDLNRGKAAFFFGNERDGLSDTVLNKADEFLHIPMEGFVESLNISASCALIIQQLGDRLRNSTISWHIDKVRQDEILLSWMKGSIKKIDHIIAAKKS
ncbi:MAG: RNA methyltransferase [Spirochaetaceae bacterium]|nr:RNA methyltransferase [Spirochaetaceae bacterium]